jgi:hypothetical protein
MNLQKTITYMGTTWEGGVYSLTIEHFFPEYDDRSVPVQKVQLSDGCR